MRPTRIPSAASAGRAAARQAGPSAWSRFWGAAAVVGFWLYLGAALYEGAVLAPQWAGSPPQSVRAWNQSGVRPEPAHLLTPLAVLVVGATTLAWASSLGARSGRRWWLTLAETASLALGWIVAMGLMPIERALRGASLPDLVVIDLTGEWVRWSAMRLAVLAAGGYAAYRAHISRALVLPAASIEARRAAPRDFVMSDDDPDRITFGDD